MAHWLDKYLRMKPEVRNIFDELDAYREFCVEYGYVFNEAHLYNEKTPYGEFVRAKNGKIPRNNWTNPKPEWYKKPRKFHQGH